MHVRSRLQSSANLTYSDPLSRRELVRRGMAKAINCPRSAFPLSPYSLIFSIEVIGSIDVILGKI